jgi:hypothetical protein
MSNFVTKDSGERVAFAKGGVRDVENGKPRYDLISPEFLKRLAELLARGAEKYGDRNWEKGQTVSRAYSSMFRHMQQWYTGDRTEDHLAAIAFNVMVIVTMEERAITDPDLQQFLNLDFYEDLPEYVVKGNPLQLEFDGHVISEEFDRRAFDAVIAEYQSEGATAVKLHRLANQAYGYFKNDGMWERFVEFVNRNYPDRYDHVDGFFDLKTGGVTFTDNMKRRINEAIERLNHKEPDRFFSTLTLFNEAFDRHPTPDEEKAMEDFMDKEHPACRVKGQIIRKWNLSLHDCPF